MVELTLIAVSWATAYVIGFHIGRLRTQAEHVQRDMQRLVDQVEGMATHNDGTREAL